MKPFDKKLDGVLPFPGNVAFVQKQNDQANNDRFESLLTPVAPTDLCRCSWPAPPLGPHHSVECPLFRAADPVAERAIPGACYCSDRMSGGVPCPPNRVCPNAPKFTASNPDGASDTSEGRGAK